jgi:hypothetical protein
MLKALVIIIFLISEMKLHAQQVTDGNNISCRVIDHQKHKGFKVTYTQVVFEFDSTTWGVYLMHGLHDDPTHVVSNGNLLKMKVGAELYPLSQDWNYITRKQFNRYASRNGASLVNID